jgi:hypothetical protein
MIGRRSPPAPASLPHDGPQENRDQGHQG